jgi:hypothetical protein
MTRYIAIKPNPNHMNHNMDGRDAFPSGVTSRGLAGSLER